MAYRSQKVETEDQFVKIFRNILQCR